MRHASRLHDDSIALDWLVQARVNVEELFLLEFPETADSSAFGNAAFFHGRGGFRRALPRHRLDEVDYSHLPDGFILALDYFG